MGASAHALFFVGRAGTLKRARLWITSALEIPRETGHHPHVLVIVLHRVSWVTNMTRILTDRPQADTGRGLVYTVPLLGIGVLYYLGITAWSRWFMEHGEVITPRSQAYPSARASPQHK